MDRKSASKIATGAALSMLALTGQATAQSNREPVKVALIDVHPDRIDCDAKGVRMIDVTPARPEGFRSAQAKAGRTSHGVIVATSFVNEVRRVAPDAEIEIYTINPFIKKGGTGTDVFSMRMLKEGLSKLDGLNVRTAIITFSVDGAEDGRRIAAQFLNRDMITFAAAPNAPKDPSIYPAATPGVIAIAEGKTGASIHKDPSYRTFTKFVIDGYYVGRSGESTGSSFATPRAAAYAAIMVRSKPDTTREDVETMFDRLGHAYGTLPQGVKRIGGDEMIDELRTTAKDTTFRSIASISPWSKKTVSTEDGIQPVTMASLTTTSQGR